MAQPSDSDRALLRIIVKLTDDTHGRRPTLAEVAEAAGLSTASRGNLHRQLSRLRPTYVDWTSSARSITVTDVGLILIGAEPATEHKVELPLSEDILTLLASGLVQIEKGVRDGFPLRVPYRAPWQRGMNRLFTAFLERGRDPGDDHDVPMPTDLTAAIRLCHISPADWGVRWSNPRALLDEPLLENDQPTTFCRELAESVPTHNIESELNESHMLRIIDRAKQRRSPAAYVAFRRHLVEHPVLDQGVLLDASLNPLFSMFEGWLNDLYERVPAACVEDGAVLTCGNCGWTLQRTHDGQLRCGDDRCAVLTKGFQRDTQTITLNPDAPLFRVTPAIRRFVVAPGIHEIHLFRALKQVPGLEVDLWPGYDACDLGLTFPDGASWGIDVKDWKYARLLARRLQPFKAADGLTWTRTFYAVPDERAADDPEYLPTLRSAADRKPFEVTTLKMLIAEAKAKVQHGT